MKLCRARRLVCLAASWVHLGLWVEPANAQLLGPEFQVNSYTTTIPRFAEVAADGSGNFVVVWDSFAQDGSEWGVFGQRYDSAGIPVGSEFQVNSYTTGQQYRPKVAADAAGNFVVVWSSRPQDRSWTGVFGQRFAATGLPEGSEFQVNTYTTGDQEIPDVAADSSGNFVIVWQSADQDGSSEGVFAQRFNSAGSRLGSEFQVNSHTTDAQQLPAIAMEGSGNFVVVWTGLNQDGDQFGVFGQRFNAMGSREGGEFQINSYSTHHQHSPAVATDGTGNFVVVWHSGTSEGNSSHEGVFGQRFDSVGSRVGNEFQINSYTTTWLVSPAVAADGAGNFVVVWENYGRDGSLGGVFGQRFDSAGLPLESEFQVNSYTTGYQSNPSVAADGSGNFVVAWLSNTGQAGSGSGLFGRKMNISILANGFELGDACAWSVAVGGGCP